MNLLRFVCRVCRREVKRDGLVYNHIHNGSPACIVQIAGADCPSYDRHERVDDESTILTHDRKDRKVIHELGEILEQLQGINNRLKFIERNQVKKMAQLDDLAAAVQQVKDADAVEVAAVAATVSAVADEITRVEKVITDLQAGGANNPVIAKAITDLGSVSGNLSQSAQTLATATATLAGEQPGTVNNPIVVTITPTAAAVLPGGTQQFNAVVSGSTNLAVFFSVAPDGAGGSVDLNGLYTAPATEGTDTVVATSQADGTKTSSATVTVAAVVVPGAAPASKLRK